jgi:hypothetical protein
MYNPPVSTRPARGTRPDPRDVAELRALALRQPELVPAVSLQIDLVELQRRVQQRVSTPWLPLSAEEGAERLAHGQRLVEFEQMPVEWTEARLLVRQVTDVLRRYDAVDALQADALHRAGRHSALPELARRWYDEVVGAPAAAGIASLGRAHLERAPEMFNEVIAWALRPFLSRTAEVMQQRVSFADWRRGTCPVCAGEAELAAITPTGELLLLCGRCHARWPFDLIACPYCDERNRTCLTTFATPDNMYRVTACKSCHRYIKALDGRHAGRSVLPALDAIATLPLDAVILQKGFKN